jgi:hypothetical protein
MDVLPVFTSGRARLLDHQKLVNQFASLERRTFATGREQVIPGPSHDDCANSAAIAMSLADNKKQPIRFSQALLQRARQPISWGPRGMSTFGFWNVPSAGPLGIFLTMHVSPSSLQREAIVA